MAPSSTVQTVSQLPRKTKAQLLMEKKSQEMKQRQNQQSQPIPMGSAVSTPHSYLAGSSQTGFQPNASLPRPGQTTLTFQPINAGLAASIPTRSPQLPSQTRNTVSFGMTQPNFGTGTNFQGFKPTSTPSTGPLQFNTSSFNRSQTTNFQGNQANNISFQPYQPPAQPQVEAPKVQFAFKAPQFSTSMQPSPALQSSNQMNTTNVPPSIIQPCKTQMPSFSTQCPQFKPFTPGPAQ